MSPGVYRAPGAPDGPASDVWRLILATRSPLSYSTAAALWGLPVLTDVRLHITRFDRRRLDWPTGVRVHRVLLNPTAVTELRGLLVTTRTETLLDCLGWLPLPDARVLADRAKQQDWLHEFDIRSRLENQPGRWGNRQLHGLLSGLGDGAHSEAERRLHRLLARYGISGWQSNFDVVIGGRRYSIDVAFPAQRVAVEVDGYRYHSSADAFQSDRTRQNRLSGAGWRVLRFTWSDLADRPEYVIGAITSLLAG